MLNVRKTLSDILVELLGVHADEVTPDADVCEDLGADSLDCVELVMALEEHLGIEIEDADVDGLPKKTVQAIVDYLEDRLAHPRKKA